MFKRLQEGEGKEMFLNLETNFMNFPDLKIKKRSNFIITQAMTLHDSR